MFCSLISVVVKVICVLTGRKVVFDDRIMAIVVRLADEDGTWECVNRVAHITIGTRDDSTKPKQSNELLTKWLEVGATEGTNIQEVVFQVQSTIKGVIKGVPSRF